MKPKSLPALLSLTFAGVVLGALCSGWSSAPPAVAPGARPPLSDARRAAIRTPRPPAPPRINGPRVYGARPGRPCFYLIPVTGERPMTFTARGLPAGLAIDKKTGLVSGRARAPGRRRVTITASNARGRATATLEIVIGAAICLTPPLGWNSWNCFRTRIDAEKVRAAADMMVASGLIDHGWSYVNIDDAWAGERDTRGRIQGNARFPDMKALCDYVHGQGLKIGIYSSPGPRTCGGYPGSYRHEEQDARTYAEWGFDYVKYDWCSYGLIAPVRTEQRYAALLPAAAEILPRLGAERTALLGRQRRTLGQRARLRDIEEQLEQLHAPVPLRQRLQIERDILQEPYRRFRAALDKVDRDIVFSLCQYGKGQVWAWGAEIGGNLWRTTRDIRPSWQSLAEIGFNQNGLERWASPGRWNDPDMLEIGNGNLTPDEMLTHMTLWCLLAAPLLIGCDLTQMDDFVLSLFTNDEVLAIDQDPLGKQGYRLKQDSSREVWIKPLADGTTAVGLFNRGEQPALIKVTWSELQRPANQAVRDLWRQKELGRQSAGWGVTVAPHGAELYRIGSPRSRR